MALDLDTARGTGDVRLAPELLAAALASLTSFGNAARQFSVIARITDPAALVARADVHFGYAVEEATGRIIAPDGTPPQAGGPIIVSVRIDLPGEDRAPLQGRIVELGKILAGLSAEGWAIQAEQVARSSLERSVGEMGARPQDLARLPGLPPGLDGSGVMVGVVDFGCDFAHPVFREAGSGATRLRLLWDQNGPTPPGQPLPGRIIGPVEIDDALAKDDPYAALGYVPWENGYRTPLPEDRLKVHGTHVLGIAAGRDPGPRMGRFLGAGVAPGAALGFVHLRPRALISDGDATDVLDGVCMLFAAAEAAGMPCVVNLSLGANTGAHDGMGLLDQALDALLVVPGRAVTVSAGNNHGSGIAYSGTVTDAGPLTFGWRFDTADKSHNILRIYSARDGCLPRLRLSLARGNAQGQAAVPMGRLDDSVVEITAAGEIIGFATDAPRVPSADGSLGLLEIRLRPTGRNEVWLITLQVEAENGGASVDFHAWIERDDVQTKDSSFFDPLPAEEGCTLGSLACAGRPICVGAYDRLGRGAAAFSSRGPTRIGAEKPDLVAPGTGITGPAARGGEWPRQSAAFEADGTSAAAPHVAGLVALMFQLRPRLAADRIREILRTTTFEAQASPAAPWDPGLGCGRVDAGAALALTLQEP